MATERPWTCGEWSAGDDGDEGLIYAENLLIGDCDQAGIDAAEMDANARLMSSAPKLYECLAAMVGEWNAAGMMENVTLANARAALAKANGGGA